MVRHKYLSRSVGGRGQSFAHHPESLNLLADRRNRGGPHDVSSGKDWRPTKLGLPDLLAPRREFYVVGVDESRIFSGGDRLAKLVAARCGRQPRSSANHVWVVRRARSQGMGVESIARVRRFKARANRKRRRGAAPTRYLWRSRQPFALRARRKTSEQWREYRSGMGAPYTFRNDLARA